MTKPSRHDHVGSMVFDDDTCYCSDCGQTWRFVVKRKQNGDIMTSQSGWRPTGGGYAA